ncbi:MAG: DUF3108 domain-containing protein [Pseudomonadota bacterium]|nr:DUF3108 domain-containing protein [Pseudomonadota bacterium]
MNVFYRTFAVLSWLFMSIHIMAQPSDVPRTFKVTYKADYRGLPISAKGIRELQQTASGQHLLKSSAKSLFATIEESSTFLLKDGIAQPQAYRYQRTGLGKNKKINLDFDWSGRIVIDRLKKTQYPLKPGLATSDKLLYQFQLQADLLKASRLNKKPNNLNYTIMDESRIKEYQFEIVGEELLTTKLGQINTWKIRRSNSATERSTTLWMAPEYEFMLVRFEQTDQNNKGFSLMIEEAQMAGALISEF